ncbi:2-dehydropantoate 2-reductase [Domibacillus indicus]|uniref:2-dehydropantoate 2-reductase n=1 Tax=Domibacillus indicus TaxID=1437523 RepID=UPI000618025D|nr:2-dehydropantoate 2-reductase [Domibacillus indicus]
MNIHIIGGGAIGLFFASQWCSGHKVTVQTRTKEQGERIEKEGIRVIENGREAVYMVKAASSAPAETELAVIAVKQYHLDGVLQNLPNAPSLLFVQNGLSHFEQMQRLVHSNVYAASVTHGISRVDGRSIEVNGRNTTKVASIIGGSDKIGSVLETVNFSFHWEMDAYKMLVDKMAANTVINPLTALLNVKNGELVENPAYRAAVKTLCEEFVSVFPYYSKEEAAESVLAVCRRTASNESSMLGDVKAGRITELDAIVGALLNEAARKNIQTSAFTILYSLVKGKAGG